MSQTRHVPKLVVGLVVCIMLGSEAPQALALPVHNLTTGVDYATIQLAIDDADPYDEIQVDPGLYVENIKILDFKHIYLHSLDPTDASVVAATVISGGGVNTVVRIESGEISGFTITNGGNTGTDAGGVHAMNSAWVTNNVITSNAASLKGGGVKARDTAVIAGNWIHSNTAELLGGGVFARMDSVVINNCIAFNSVIQSGGGGGGVNAGENSTIRNNTIVYNSAFDEGGGGVYLRDSPVVLSNVVAFSIDGGGIFKLSIGPGGEILDYNCVFSNYNEDYGANYVGAAIRGPNDLVVDPMLVSDIDFHLLASSPCIDAGDPDLVPLGGEVDIDGETRIVNGRVDIGFDECQVCLP